MTIWALVKLLQVKEPAKAPRKKQALHEDRGRSSQDVHYLASTVSSDEEAQADYDRVMCNQSSISSVWYIYSVIWDVRQASVSHIQYSQTTNESKKALDTHTPFPTFRAPLGHKLERALKPNLRSSPGT
jgi:hypothetical protein